MIALQASLLGVSDRPLATVVSLLFAAACLPLAVRVLRRPGTTLATLLGVAALLRVLALPLAPTLSDDVFRYLWDGRVAQAGENPYALAPADGRLAPLRDDLWRDLPHKDVPTVYPPAALAAFSIATLAPGSGADLPAWKLLLTLVDLAGCWLLARLALVLGLPLERVAWYAWNPLVVLETSGMGHVDALGVAAAIGAVLALAHHHLRAPTRERMSPAASARRLPIAAGVAAALGVLAKLVPLVALPAWGWVARRRLSFAAACLGLLVVAGLPVLLATGGVPPGLVTYGVSWEFNGPLYEPLWRSLDAVGVEGVVKGLLDRVKPWGDAAWHERVNGLYPYVYPRLLAKACLGLLLVWGIARSVRAGAAARGDSDGRRIVRLTGDLFAVVILVSATVYPWYLLWMLPWAALERRTPWLLAAALAPLAYLPQILPDHPQMDLFPWIWALVWLPPAALAVWNRHEANP